MQKCVSFKIHNQIFSTHGFASSRAVIDCVHCCGHNARTSFRLILAGLVFHNRIPPRLSHYPRRFTWRFIWEPFRSFEPSEELKLPSKIRVTPRKIITHNFPHQSKIKIKIVSYNFSFTKLLPKNWQDLFASNFAIKVLTAWFFIVKQKNGVKNVEKLGNSSRWKDEKEICKKSCKIRV